jgi:hypothetical protein
VTRREAILGALACLVAPAAEVAPVPMFSAGGVVPDDVRLRLGERVVSGKGSGGPVVVHLSMPLRLPDVVRSGRPLRDALRRLGSRCS